MQGHSLTCWAELVPPSNARVVRVPESGVHVRRRLPEASGQLNRDARFRRGVGPDLRDLG